MKTSNSRDAKDAKGTRAGRARLPKYSNQTGRCRRIIRETLTLTDCWLWYSYSYWYLYSHTHTRSEALKLFDCLRRCCSPRNRTDSNTSARNASRRATENWKWNRVVAAVAAEVSAANAADVAQWLLRVWLLGMVASIIWKGSENRKQNANTWDFYKALNNLLLLLIIYSNVKINLEIKKYSKKKKKWIYNKKEIKPNILKRDLRGVFILFLSKFEAK